MKNTEKADIEMGGMTVAQAATKLRKAFENFVSTKAACRYCGKPARINRLTCGEEKCNEWTSQHIND